MSMRTKVSEKNMANVMGKINTFFKNGAVEDLGMRDQIVGYEKVKIEGLGCEWDKPIVETARMFIPYPGRCDVHGMRKKMLEKILKGEVLWSIDKTDVALSVSTNNSCDCIPIRLGDIVTIKGNNLEIKQLGRFGGTRKFVRKVLTKKEIADSIKRDTLNFLAWFTDDSMWIDFIGGDKLDIISFNMELSRMFNNFIESIDFETAAGLQTLNVDVDKMVEDIFVENEGVCFDFVVDMDAINSGKMNEAMYIVFEDKKSMDTYAVVTAAFDCFASYPEEDSEEFEEEWDEVFAEEYNEA